jgi:hypothetical protein
LDESGSDEAPLIPYFDASVVYSDIPGMMLTGNNYNVHITVRNTGSVIWDSSCGLMLGGVGDSQGDAALFGSTRISIPAGVNVAPGENYTRNFMMTAPNQYGSYFPEYQMVCSDEWFGEILTKNVTVQWHPPGFNYLKSHVINGSVDGAFWIIR